MILKKKFKNIFKNKKYFKIQSLYSYIQPDFLPLLSGLRKYRQQDLNFHTKKNIIFFESLFNSHRLNAATP